MNDPNSTCCKYSMRTKQVCKFLQWKVKSILYRTGVSEPEVLVTDYLWLENKVIKEGVVYVGL